MKYTPKQLPPSREVEWGIRFATRVAEERKALRLETRDLFVGMYLSSVERLGRYWDEWEHLEDFLVAECDLQKPRLLYWCEMCKLLSSGDLPQGLSVFEEEASHILVRAGQVAFESGSDEIQLEHFLAAIAESEIGICRRFVASGMNIDRVRSRMGR